jgi:2-keto-4-pentenoate hydratase
MPKGTKVARCVEKVKGKKGVNAYAVCQASTGQSYATGKMLKGRKKKSKHDSMREGYEVMHDE